MERGQHFKASSSEIARVSCGELQDVGCGGGAFYKTKVLSCGDLWNGIEQSTFDRKSYLTVVCCLNFFFTWRLNGSILPVC